MIDVIIAAYNAEASIEAAVRSALRVPAARVLVVDDGSTDRTGERAIRAGAEVLRQPNAGASVARENGRRATAAEFIVFLDSDDEILAEGVERSLAMLQAAPTASVAAGRVVGRWGSRSRVLASTYSSSPSTLELVRGGHGPWPPAAALIRRSSLEASRALSVRELRPRYAEDYEMFIRLSLVGELISHELPSALYSMYGGKSTRAALSALGDKEWIRSHYAQEFNIPIRAMSQREILAAAAARQLRAEVANGSARAVFAALGRILQYPDFVYVKLRGRIFRRGA